MSACAQASAFKSHRYGLCTAGRTACDSYKCDGVSCLEEHLDGISGTLEDMPAQAPVIWYVQLFSSNFPASKAQIGSLWTWKLDDITGNGKGGKRG